MTARTNIKNYSFFIKILFPFFMHFHHQRYVFLSFQMFSVWHLWLPFTLFSCLSFFLWIDHFSRFIATPLSHINYVSISFQTFRLCVKSSKRSVAFHWHKRSRDTSQSQAKQRKWDDRGKEGPYFNDVTPIHKNQFELGNLWLYLSM